MLAWWQDISAIQFNICIFNNDNNIMLLWNVYSLIWTFSPPNHKNIFSPSVNSIYFVTTMSPVIKQFLKITYAHMTFECFHFSFSLSNRMVWLGFKYESFTLHCSWQLWHHICRCCHRIFFHKSSHYVSSFSVAGCTCGFSEPLPRETVDDIQNNIPGHFQDFVAGR